MTRLRSLTAAGCMPSNYKNALHQAEQLNAKWST